jgi:hypothetical protein
VKETQYEPANIDYSEPIVRKVKSKKQKIKWREIKKQRSKK